MGRTQRTRIRRKVSLLDSKMEVTIPEAKIYLPLLYKYLSSFGWRNETKLTVRNFKGTGRGLCSKRSINAGDDLIKIPINALVNIATIEADQSFKSLFDNSKFNKDTQIPFQCLMALYLLYHKHLKSKSMIEPYINSIPTNFSTPYFCATDERYCLPDAILEKNVEQNRKIRTSFKNLEAVFIADNCCQCCGQQYFTEIFSIDAFKWSYFAINSRSVYINSQQLNCKETFFKSLINDGTNLALSPFLDLFNHSDHVSTTAALIPRSTDKQLQFVLTLDHVATAALPYEQLFISYGLLSNFKLLTEYGFFLRCNKYDLFEISLLDIENFIKSDKSFSKNEFHRNKFKFIRDHNLDDQMFLNLNEGISHNLHVVLHLLFKVSTHYPNVLNQIAFGAAENLDNINFEVQMLVEFKEKEYKNYINGLNKIKPLTDSGHIALKYMEECIRYFKEYLSKI